MQLVIVESPAKAKTINKYLGKDYKVLASFGHVRDLSSKNGSVDPTNDFALTWEIDTNSKKHLSELVKVAEQADNIILATDPDREGEAISWHIYDIMKSKKKLKDKPFQRVVFNEITAKAVKNAMKSPREIDDNLVQAYLTRRSLDYLVGYTLSPVLWRKLPGAKSAGRVQSVALRIICDREAEIEAFKPQAYWSIEALLKPNTSSLDQFTAKLTEYNNNKLDKLDISSASQAIDIQNTLNESHFSVQDIQAKEIHRAPYPPFTTSTLQQAAASKYGFSAKTTMQIAQKLYEGVDVDGETSGFITYMRTDGVQMAEEAIQEARETIQNKYGKEYLPTAPRIYTAKAKNAQEAHEAIRPTSFAMDCERAKKYLNSEQLKIYELIWTRAVASQMMSAKFERTTIQIKAANDQNTAILKTTGSVVLFNGFLSIYKDPNKDNSDSQLPKLQTGDVLNKEEIVIKEHSTEAPPRYSEASIIKKLEELGIGRPSTYAAILSTLQERGYVVSEKNKLTPNSKGRIVTEFLKKFFAKYVEYDFTANLEEELDLISDGKLIRKEVLYKFWEDFNANIINTSKLRIGDVIDTLNESLQVLLFPTKDDETDPRKCPVCNDGQLSLKLSKHGAFIGCSNYPECNYTRQMGEDSDTSLENQQPNDRILGHNDNGDEIHLLHGRYGPYVQIGIDKKAKKTSIPKDIDPNEVNLDLALKLLSLPREVGIHPETNEMITASIGRYGPYLLHNGEYATLKNTNQLLNIGLEEALNEIEAKKSKRSTRKSPSSNAAIILDLGSDEKLGKITVNNGRYGPYIKCLKVNATLPKDMNPENVTLEQAIKIVEDKLNKSKK